MTCFADAHQVQSIRERLCSRAGWPLLLGGLLCAPVAAIAQAGAATGVQPAPPPLAESRETAVVRAAERISSSIVTVNVLQTEQVCTEYVAFFGLCGRTATRGVPSLGSGFVIDASGIVVTNDHVVRGAERILVTFPDGTDAVATLVGSDEATDVAVLEIEGSGYTPVPIGRTTDLRIGEWVIAFGSPFGNLLSNSEPTVTVGVTSAVGRHLVPSQDGGGGLYLDMIQTDAAINPGNSGGPLANADGEVIGMNASILSRSGGSEGMGFAIPIERVLRIAEDIREHGHVRRAYVGVQVTEAEGDEFGRTRGVRVSRVAAGSPADRAGVRVGDRLLEVSGRRMATPYDFEAALLDLPAGTDVSLLIDGGWAAISMRSEELPSLHAERARIFNGVDILTLTDGVRGEYNISSAPGALVVGISAQIQGQLNLAPGDVIVQVNDRTVSGAEEVSSLVADLPRGVPHRFVVERQGRLLPTPFTLSR